MSISHKYILLIISLIGYSSLFSQNTSELERLDNDKIRFKKVFDKEMLQYDTVQDHKRKVIKPEILPSWINNTKTDGNETRILGISDPGMPIKKARQQALHRIKLIYCLLNNSTIKILNDIYAKENSDENNNFYERKYESFSKIEATCQIDTSSIKIIKTYTTKYDELLLLGSIKNNLPGEKHTDTISVKVENIVVDINIDDDFENQKAITIHALEYNKNKDVQKYFYTYKRTGNRYNISSSINTRQIRIPELYYHYDTQKETVFDSNAVIYRTNNGLWRGYIEAIISQMHHLAYQDNTKIKTMNEDYDKKVYQDLNRYVTKCNDKYIINRCLFNTKGICMTMTGNGMMF